MRKMLVVAARDYKDILTKVDAVVVAVPTPLHNEVGTAVLGRGLDGRCRLGAWRG